MRNDVNVNELLIAVRAHCLECSGGSRNDVETCLVKNCNLYPYRNVNAISAKREPVQLDHQIGMFDKDKKGDEQIGKQKRSRRS